MDYHGVVSEVSDKYVVIQLLEGVADDVAS